MTVCLALSPEPRVQAGYIYTTLTPPNSDRSEAYGINDKGDVVGSYYGPSGNIGANGLVYGFTATAVPEPASVILLAGGLGFMFAAAAFARGQVSAGGRR
jgi:hypothetical protein